MNILKRSFYNRDTTLVAQELLGKTIVRVINKKIILKAKIVETEAYLGIVDEASHAYGGMRVRNAPLFGPVGHAYVYFTYGMYHCLNFIAREEKEVVAGGVLIRALEPIAGIEYMEKLRQKHSAHGLTNGPGKLTIALAINRELNGSDVTKKDQLYVLDAPLIPQSNIVATTRIGISQAKDDILRFYIKDNVFVSKR
jgi:DNA-3-methyladenine glycosylase